MSYQPHKPICLGDNAIVQGRKQRQSSGIYRKNIAAPFGVTRALILKQDCRATHTPTPCISRVLLEEGIV